SSVLYLIRLATIRAAGRSGARGKASASARVSPHRQHGTPLRVGLPIFSVLVTSVVSCMILWWGNEREEIKKAAEQAQKAAEQAVQAAERAIVFAAKWQEHEDVVQQANKTLGQVVTTIAPNVVDRLAAQQVAGRREAAKARADAHGQARAAAQSAK